jgi:uncharacterized protein (DUF433 family)
MLQTATEYVYQTAQGGWRVAGSRVSLDSVVHAYLRGESPEAICDDFEALSLEQVHGAIAFYLHNKAAIDQYLAENEALFDRLAAESRQRNAPLLVRLRKLQAAKNAISGDPRAARVFMPTRT